MPRGKTTPAIAPPTITDNTGQIFTAALFEAIQTDCQCEVCRLMKIIGGRLRTDLLKGVK